jgi:ribosomal protein L7/L12
MKLNPQLRQKVIELLEQGRKFEAVKLVFKETGAGLKISKDAVDAITREIAKQ